VLLKPGGDGPFPALVLSHGLGGSAQSMRRQAGEKFVSMGFVCIMPNYTHEAAAAMRARQGGQGPRNERGGPVPPGERGMRRGGQEDFGASPENVKRARHCLEILGSLPYVDQKRIGAYGHSMGAFLTVAFAADAPDKIRAAAITAGGISGRAGFPAPPPEVAAKVRVPLLILHGTADTTVLPRASEALKAVLDENKVPNSRHTFDGVGHDLTRAEGDACFRLMREWFGKYGLLKEGADR
jgi:dienelactone hydrolase